VISPIVGRWEVSSPILAQSHLLPRFSGEFGPNQRGASTKSMLANL
jgi:hypothetical protein